MFSESKKGKSAFDADAQPNRIGKTTKLVGDMVSNADLRIDGELEGSIKTTGKVVVGQDGFVKGTVECESADIEGKLSGELTVSGVLTLKSSAFIEGSVIVSKLSVAPGATFNASCEMKGADVKPISNNSKKVEKTA